MARPRSTDDDQNYMLAEIIKSVSPSPTTMLNLVMQLGAHQPRWDDMPLPPGTLESTPKISIKRHSHTSLRSIRQRMPRRVRRLETQLRVLTLIANNSTPNTIVRSHRPTSTTVAARNDNFIRKCPSGSPTPAKGQNRRAGRRDGHASIFDDSRRPGKTQTRSTNEGRSPG